MRKTNGLWGAGLALLALAVFAGCGGDEGGKAPPPKAGGGDAAGGGEVKRPEGAGRAEAYDAAKATATVVVKATLNGKAPAMRPVKFDADPKCGELHSEKVLDEAVVVSDGKLANVIAYVSSGADKWSYKVPAEAVVLDQKGCMYHPHVFTLMKGQAITIKNSDPVMHNIHAVPKANDEFNKSQIAGAADLTEKFAKEEVGIKIKCDVHGWMTSWAGTFSHPFHGVTGADGTASIKLPPGDYEIAVWHEYEGFKKPAAQKVTVGDGESKTLDFVFEAK